jgi:hypothetical protein
MCFPSLDHLVREKENRSRDGHAERLSGFEIDYELKASWSLNGLLRRICAVEDLSRKHPSTRQNSTLAHSPVSRLPGAPREILTGFSDDCA